MGAKRNAVTGLITQLIIIALGLIVPRIMITNYGSDTNGLTNTLTQIFSYIALLEAGIGQSTRNALYKPITENDRDGVCKILSVSRKYYWKITKYYAAIVVAMALLLPFILKTNLSAKTVFAVVFFEGMSGVVRFMFTENWMQLLTAEGKGYVQANITLMGRLLTYGIKIVLACMKINIVAIQFGFFCVSLIQLAVYKIYIDKNYSWIKYDIKACDETELPDKNAYVLTEVAWTVFSSTDMILLSVMFSTALSSVYSVYNMIYSNISVLMSAIYTSLLYLLGQAYSENIKKYETVHDEFELLFMTAVAVLMSCCSLLAIPFVQLYTKGVTDVNYIYIFLPTMFGLIQILSWDRYVTGNLSGIAGHAKMVSKISVIEAASNIVLSVLLAPRMGLYGITLATVISLVFKLAYLTYLGNVVILKRGIWSSLSKILCYLGTYLVIAFIGIIKPLKISSFARFILYGFITLTLVMVVFIILAYIIDRKTFKILAKRIGGKMHRIKKHILALLILFASWMAFVCYISFSSESIITMIIKKVIYVLVIGIVLPSFFIIRDKKLNGLFSRVRGWSVKHTLRECGKNLRVGKNVKFFNPQKIQLGDNCDVADDVVFAPLVKHNGNNYSSEIIVGNNVHFGTQDRIASKDAVIIEDDVLFAAFVHITDHSHDYHDVRLPISKQGVIGKGKVVVKKGAWLAFGCHVLSGVTIGENSVVAANSVVTKDVPPFSVVAGNPARVVSTYNFKTNQWEKVKNA